MTPRFRRLRFPLAILCCMISLGLLSSCQDSVTIIEESGPTATSAPSNHPTGTFRMSDTALLPDSIGFRTRLDSGSAPSTRVRLEASTEVSFRPKLSQPLGSDSMLVDLYTLGLRTMRLVYKQGDNGDELKLAYSSPSAADSAAARLVRAFQLVRKLEASAHSRLDSPRDSQVADFRQTIAQLSFDGNDAAKGVSSKPPRGLDTADLNSRVLRLAVKSGLSLGEAARKWTISLTAIQAQQLAPKISLDVTALSPFKWQTPLSIETLRPFETNQSLRGKLFGKLGIRSIDVSIVGSDDKPVSGFGTSGIPDLTSSPTELTISGQIGVVVRPEAKSGNYTVLVSVSDSFDNRGIFRLPVAMGDAPDREGPSVEFVDPSPVASGRILLSFSDSSISVKVRVLDRSGVKSVRIQGKAADSLGGDLWSAKVHPVLGDDSVIVEATDVPGTMRSATLAIHRCQKMTITLLIPSRPDTSVPSTTTSIPVAWSVKGAATVRIGNGISTSTTDRHDASATLTEGPNRIFLAGVDSAGKPDTNSVSITRRFLSPLSISYGVDTAATLPDSAVVVALSDAGAKFWWSIGGTSWTEFSGRMTWRTNGALQIRVTVAGKDTNTKTLPNRQFYHVNRAPTVAVVKNSVVVKSYLGSFTVAGVAKVLDWGLGDGVQSGNWELQFQDPSANQFLTKVSTDAQGNIGGLLTKDTSVTLKFRMRVSDDGGTTNGGVDLSDWTAWMDLQIVDTAQDADHNVYRALRMPDGKVWMRSNLRTMPETQFDPDTTCTYAGGCAIGRYYSLIQAFTYSAAMNNALYNAPTRGICPSGWHISAKSEWSDLFKATIPIGEVDSMFALRTDSSWHWSGRQSPGGARSGGGSFGEFVLPNGSYAMSGDELWLWLPKQAVENPSGPLMYGLQFKMQASDRAGIRCVMD